MDDYLAQFKKMLDCRNLSPHTRDQYASTITQFLDYFDTQLHKDPASFEWGEIRAFFDRLKATKNLSDRTINSDIAHLENFIIYVLHKHWDPTQVPKRKFDKYIPFVPTKEQFRTLLNAADNIRYKTMLIIMYSAGLRCQETCNLRYCDIHVKEHRIYVSVSKNRSDRYAILGKATVQALTDYWKSLGSPEIEDKTEYLFPSPMIPSMPISTTSVQTYVRKIADSIGLDKLTCHSLRHAFGTECYRSGVDIFRLKELMGHNTITSTLIYITLAHQDFNGITSPIDTL